MRRQSLALSLIVLLLVAGGGWWWKARSAGGRSGAVTADGAPAPARGASGAGGTQLVGVVTAQRRDVPVTVEASGTVTPINQVKGVIAVPTGAGLGIEIDRKVIDRYRVT